MSNFIVVGDVCIDFDKVLYFNYDPHYDKPEIHSHMEGGSTVCIKGKL